MINYFEFEKEIEKIDDLINKKNADDSKNPKEIKQLENEKKVKHKQY